MIVENGADYDAYMDKAQKNPDTPVISAFDVYKKANPTPPPARDRSTSTSSTTSPS